MNHKTTIKVYFRWLLIFLLVGCSNSNANPQLNLKKMEQIKEPIFINELALEPSNISPIRIFWLNLGSKTFHQVNFTISIFNEKGNKVLKIQAKNVGPHPPMNQKGKFPLNQTWLLGNWYQESMVCLTLDKIEITFIDQTKAIIETPEHLKKVIAPKTLQECQRF